MKLYSADNARHQLRIAFLVHQEGIQCGFWDLLSSINTRVCTRRRVPFLVRREACQCAEARSFEGLTRHIERFGSLLPPTALAASCAPPCWCTGDLLVWVVYPWPSLAIAFACTMAAIRASRSPMARIYVCLNCGPTLGVVVEHQ